MREGCQPVRACLHFRILLRWGCPLLAELSGERAVGGHADIVGRTAVDAGNGANAPEVFR